MQTLFNHLGIDTLPAGGTGNILSMGGVQAPSCAGGMQGWRPGLAAPSERGRTGTAKWAWQPPGRPLSPGMAGPVLANLSAAAQSGYKLGQ
jgi:hypothetical protein